MQIEEFDPAADGAQLRACFEMTQAGWPADHPAAAPWPLDSFTGKWIHGFAARSQRCWLATADDGEPVGGYLLRLDEKENQSVARCILIVRPDRRRAGVGRALAAHCAGQAQLAGRTRLTATVRDDSAGAAFAATLGAVSGMPEIDRILHLGSALPGRLMQLRAAALPHAAGYSLVSWSGPVPGEFLGHVVQLHNAMADAPRDAGLEPMIWDAERIRASERDSTASGLRYHRVLAVHDRTGEAAGLTEICIDSGTPDWAFQMMTAVVPAHRGHRLGVLIKVANLEQLASAEPQVCRVLTGNAGSNEHMIAINTQLGFEIADVYRNWELDLAPLVQRGSRGQS